MPLVFSLSDTVRWSDVSIKGIRMRYAELMAFLSIFKGPVNMN